MVYEGVKNVNLLYAAGISIVFYYFLEFTFNIIYKRQIVLRNRLFEVESEKSAGLHRSRHKTKKEKNKGIFRVPDKIRVSLISSGITLRPEEFVAIWAAAMFMPGLILLGLGKNPITCFVTFLIGAVLPPIYVSTAKNKRKEKFTQQLGDALLIISNSLRAGFTFEQSLSNISRDLPNPLGEEFSKVVRELELGGSLERSLNSLAERMKSKDMELLNTAVIIQRQVGGNLSEIIDVISETIRERITIKRTIKTLTSQGRISGKVIGALPIFLLLIISFINPSYMEPVYTTQYGHTMLIICILLEGIGFFLINKIINIEM